MTPLEFNSFRSFLEAASGFQSAQFRELEFVLGYKREAIFSRYPENTASWDRLKTRYAQPTLWDALLYYLAQKRYPVPEPQLHRDVTRPIARDADDDH